MAVFRVRRVALEVRKLACAFVCGFDYEKGNVQSKAAASCRTKEAFWTPPELRFSKK